MKSEIFHIKKPELIRKSCITLCFLVFFSLWTFADREVSDRKDPRVIVIDAGHGGRDVGAVGTTSKEKNIALKVALQLRDALHRALPGTKIIMTRTSDITQDVKTKANIANRAKGDLFISIHCNSTPTRTIKKGKKTIHGTGTARGTETYVWAADKISVKREAIKKHSTENIKSNSAESRILTRLKTRQYFQRSTLLAQEIQKQFLKIGRSCRKAKQRHKGIWVLQATAMPSILIELGFINTPSEERYLSSKSGQKEMANCIKNAIVSYRKNLHLKTQISTKNATSSKQASRKHTSGKK